MPLLQKNPLALYRYEIFYSIIYIIMHYCIIYIIIDEKEKILEVHY